MTTMTQDPVSTPSAHTAVEVRRWPGERRLFALCVAVSLLLWIVMAVSIIGLLYGVMIAAFLFLAHVAFIAHVRGSAVRIGPDQLPELHARIDEIARTFGMRKVPAAYLLQGDGALNAFATRFMRSHMIILLSDLLDACGDDTAARDMIIGHELGHIHAGHLRWRWLILPAQFTPFLGGALSRAREYTCDRFGLVAAGNQNSALLGLTILAAGGKQARAVNRSALVAQRADMNTGWMRIGEWLSTHPPLARRITALDPGYGRVNDGAAVGTLRALAILGATSAALIALSAFGIARIPALLDPPIVDELVEAQADEYVAPEFTVAVAQLDEAVARVAGYIAGEVRQGRPIPASYADLESRWETEHAGEPLPIDPFDGYRLGYSRTRDGYVLWSTGSDGRANTHADIVYRFDSNANRIL